MVSTTSPQMNVDNGVHLYRYDDGLVDEGRLPWDNSRYRPGKLLFAGYVPVPTRYVCGLTTTGQGGRGPRSSRGIWAWRGAWLCGRAGGRARTAGWRTGGEGDPLLLLMVQLGGVAHEVGRVAGSLRRL